MQDSEETAAFLDSVASLDQRGSRGRIRHPPSGDAAEQGLYRRDGKSGRQRSRR